MPRRIFPLTLFTGLVLCCCSGCKYDRSFLHMDSNTGSPFLGLQLSVDAAQGKRGPHQHESSLTQVASVAPRVTDREYPAEIPDIPGLRGDAAGTMVRTSDGVSVNSATSAADDRGLIYTAASTPTAPRVRHSLPVAGSTLPESDVRNRLSMF